MSNPFGPSIKRRHYRFTLRQITIALIKDADIHEGLWQLQVMFAQSAANLTVNGHVTPTALSQFVGLQLGRVETADDLSVDAEEVNPRPRIITPVTVN